MKYSVATKEEIRESKGYVAVSTCAMGLRFQTMDYGPEEIAELIAHLQAWLDTGSLKVEDESE